MRWLPRLRACGRILLGRRCKYLKVHSLRRRFVKPLTDGDAARCCCRRRARTAPALSCWSVWLHE